MELADLFLTTVYLIIFYVIAYRLRPRFTSKTTRKFFIPGLTVKFIGAIGLGLIYQFYYGGGDTFNYYAHVKIVFQAFMDSPAAGFKIIFNKPTFDPAIYQYTSRLEWYGSPTEFFIVRLASILALFAFDSYSVIALFFAALSFSGMWAMYLTFLKIRPNLTKQFAIAVFFLPSVFFWGSGLMKDSITLGALGWLFFGFYRAFIEKRKIMASLLIISLAGYVIATVKIYILLSFLPPALFWIFTENNARIKSAFLRNLARPLFLGIGLAVALYGTTTLTEGDTRYDLENMGERSRINTLYLSQQVQTGSAYDIGIFDGTLGSALTVGPQAIVVSLFRPFLWEVRNPIMLLSALEATLFIVLTLTLTYRTGFFKTIRLIASKPILTFCIIFALILAFGVGTNSGNFGTLVRYKIPLMPFYLGALYLMQDYVKQKKRKLVLSH